MNENPKDSKKLQQILKKAEVEHIEEMCEEIIEYDGLYKKQLILLHDAVLKEAEKLNTDVGFEYRMFCSPPWPVPPEIRVVHGTSHRCTITGTATYKLTKVNV